MTVSATNITALNPAQRRPGAKHPTNSLQYKED